MRFSNSKNKVFILEGEQGKTLVGSIAHQIHERASEWRAMPRLPRSANHVGTDLLAATQSNGEVADNLRKTDVLTMRRAGFAIKLRDFEAYERDLLPEAWTEHRRAFFRAFTQHVLVLPQFFDLAVYLPRVIRLATACEDFAELSRIIKALRELYMQVGEQCEIGVKAWPEGQEKPDPVKMLARWEKQLFSRVRESISAAFPPRLSREGKASWHMHMRNCLPARSVGAAANKLFSYKRFQIEQARLFSLDLAHMPFRFIGLPKEMVAQRGIPAKKTIPGFENAAELLPDSVLNGAQTLAHWIGFKHMPPGLPFATRPFNLPEMFILNRHAYSQAAQDSMRSVVLSVRGFELVRKRQFSIRTTYCRYRTV